jgi:hypothetical protein
LAVPVKLSQSKPIGIAPSSMIFGGRCFAAKAAAGFNRRRTAILLASAPIYGRAEGHRPRSVILPIHSTPPGSILRMWCDAVSCFPSKDGGPMPQPKPAAEKFNMQIEGLPAKFVSPWRIRRQR